MRSEPRLALYVAFRAESEGERWRTEEERSDDRWQEHD
jgi:hypothetical protein